MFDGECRKIDDCQWIAVKIGRMVRVRVTKPTGSLGGAPPQDGGFSPNSDVVAVSGSIESALSMAISSLVKLLPFLY
jgi:hypothetical protein